ncbi:tail assembly chaperone [Escherichia coli]|nr:tail assembly chaperone [Escherichia coli]SQX06640.1 tail assembly chaperone [Escherichia coli]SQX54022.1 tail assembly chaperone [Escherichia coli]SQX81471.1 tail assembly chaperone [Escherichia coli]SQZ46890.1 tail assembly chaperone [Escherichia coli]
MTKNIRNLALATMSGFRHKTVDVPEWEGATVVLREPSAEAWLRWQEIVKAKDDETPLSVAERARRNLEADVELFIDVLCDTGLQPVFSEDDREQVIAVYGPVHARLLRKRAARTVLTGMCYSVGSATRQGSSSPTRFIGQSAMTSRT